MLRRLRLFGGLPSFYKEQGKRHGNNGGKEKTTKIRCCRRAEFAGGLTRQRKPVVISRTSRV